MELSLIIPHIEALIFASDKPLPAAEIVEHINNALGFIEDIATIEQVNTAIEGIKEKYDSDKFFDGKISGINEIGQADSLPKILVALKKNNLI